MTELMSLWLPIVLSAVVVFVVSSIIHMASPWHKNDFPGLPNETAAMDALRPLAIPPGDYVMPRPASAKDMKSPDFIAKMNQGPVVIFTVVANGPAAMGKRLGLWLIYLLGVSAASAIVALALPAGADHRVVFHTVGVAAFLGYAAALVQMSIWYSRSWMITCKAAIDGLIYAALTAETFVLLWPR